MSNYSKRREKEKKIPLWIKIAIIPVFLGVAYFLFLGTKVHGLKPGAWGGSSTNSTNVFVYSGLVNESNMTGTVKIFDNCRSGAILYEDQYYSLVTFVGDMPQYGDIVQGSFVYNNLQELKDITENKQIKVFVMGASSSFEENLDWIRKNCVQG